MKVKKVLLVALGCVGLVLGAVGAVVPLLPAFPFLMLAAFCFAQELGAACTRGSRAPGSTRGTSRAT